MASECQKLRRACQVLLQGAREHSPHQPQSHEYGKCWLALLNGLDNDEHAHVTRPFALRCVLVLAPHVRLLLPPSGYHETHDNNTGNNKTGNNTGNNIGNSSAHVRMGRGRRLLSRCFNAKVNQLEHNTNTIDIDYWVVARKIRRVMDTDDAWQIRLLACSVLAEWLRFRHSYVNDYTQTNSNKNIFDLSIINFYSFA